MKSLLDDTGANIINEIMARNGHECYFVGGAVRDTLMGLSPKDIDLATNARPDEMLKCFAGDDRTQTVILTGEAHGTITVVIDHIPYEITTYRIDRETDGRHAVVEYTRDLVSDLARRDLTMNSIAMAFDGTLVDPFGGVDDIRNNKVRFVGNARDRLREDYLRILRWFRFYGRFGKESPDVDAIAAIQEVATGLRQISVERIWSEVSRIISGPNAIEVLALMDQTRILNIIGMPFDSFTTLAQAKRFTNNPAFLVAMFTPSHVEDIAQWWKWSNAEQRIAKFARERNFTTYDIAQAKRDVVDGHSREFIAVLLYMGHRDHAARIIMDWDAPRFPLGGNDLIERGIKPGREMGKMLNCLRESWIASDYTLDRETLLESL